MRARLVLGAIGAAAVAALCTVYLFVVPPEAAELQCPDVPSEGNLSLIEELPTADGACTVPTLDAMGGVIYVPASSDLRDNGPVFVKHSSYVWLDARAQSSGKCDVYYDCIFSHQEVRNIVAIRISHGTPSGASSTYNFYPVHGDGTLDNSAQDVDTRLPQTTVLDFKRELLSGIGKHLLRHWATIGRTQCMIEPGSTPVREVVVSVTQCRPVWVLVNPGSPWVPHVPTQLIKIYVPDTMPGLYKPVDNAAADWTNWVGPVGVSFQRVTAPCGTGGDCINVVQGAVTSGCAEREFGGGGPGGVQTAPGTIRLPPGWINATEQRLRRTIGHELGHFLGLDHNTCGQSTSIMAPAGSCTSEIGMTVTPTANDIWPVRDGVYGAQVRKMCNF